MPQLLPLSRAARLVGVSRGELQSRIRRNELEAFEGMVRVSDLLRVFPETRLQDDSALERTEHIKALAQPKTHIASKLPSAQVLARRLTELSRDLTESRDEINHYVDILTQIDERLEALRDISPSDLPNAVGKFQHWLQSKVVDMPKSPRRKTEILARDTFLRMVEAHVKLVPSADEYYVEGTDTLLESGLRSGIPLRYGCTRGSCSKCKARVISGEVLKVRDHDYKISEIERNRGYILMCSYTAVTDVVIEADVARDSDDIPRQSINAQVARLDRLSKDIAILFLQTPSTYSLRFLAGQMVTLQLPSGLKQSLPIASCPCDGSQLEFHLLRHPENPVSNHILDQGITNKEVIHIDGPNGNFTLNPDSDRPVLFFAWNEGFAPTKSLVESAISIDKAESYNLYWLASEPKMHYLNNRGRTWSDAFDNFSYTPLLACDVSLESDLRKHINGIASGLSQLSQYDIYIAAPGHIIYLMTEIMLPHGLNMEQLTTLDTESICTT